MVNKLFIRCYKIFLKFRYDNFINWYYKLIKNIIILLNNLNIFFYIYMEFFFMGSLIFKIFINREIKFWLFVVCFC